MLVISGEGGPQAAHLFKIAVVVSGDGQRPGFQQLGKGRRRGIVLQCGGVGMSVERDSNFVHSSFLPPGQLQAVDPLMYIVFGGPGTKSFAGKPMRTVGQRMQIGVAGANAAGVGCAERHDGFSGEVIAL